MTEKLMLCYVFAPPYRDPNNTDQWDALPPTGAFASPLENTATSFSVQDGVPYFSLTKRSGYLKRHILAEFDILPMKEAVAWTYNRANPVKS